MSLILICNKIIEYSFYSLFFLVPLAFTSSTSELFEFNKLWVTFGITVVIGTAWFVKIILQRRIIIQRTPLDIPILIFLSAHLISTLFSLDMHISVWGYYSRFNGGLLSILSYVFLYYAFVSNLSNLGYLVVKRVLLVSLLSAAIVALWGFPSHFGYDPTCFLFRGTFDVSCWTEAFQPKVRIFSTLGQPNWLAAYLSILIPISLAFSLKNSKLEARNLNLFRISSASWRIGFMILAILFYVDLLWTQSRSGFLGLIAGLIVFGGFILLLVVWSKKKELVSSGLFIFAVFIIISLFVGSPATPKFSGLFPKEPQPATPIQTEGKSQGPALEVGGSESGKIRLIVWQGAIDAWKSSPLFGTGVETFAFAYYKFRPAAHNLTSEWDYLYNKAHNEYLNYLTTTGLFGLGSYLAIIFGFLFISIKHLLSNIHGLKLKNDKSSMIDNKYYFPAALLAAYISTLVSNFLGFSVVIINIYFFLIPAFVFILLGSLNPKKVLVFFEHSQQPNGVSKKQWLTISFILLATCYMLLTLTAYWYADTQYAYGSNLSKAGEYQMADPYLRQAVSARGDEPVFKDDFIYNSAVLSVLFAKENNATIAGQFAKRAIETSDVITSNHPNNIVFLKTRVRMLYVLSQINEQYKIPALQAIQKANILAPTDAKVAYTMGVLYGQTGDVKKGAAALQHAIKLKSDYRDAYYALGLFYRELAINEKGIVVNTDYQKKAVDTMRYILNKLGKDDKDAKDALKNWGEKQL